MGCIWGTPIDRDRCKFCSAWCSVRPSDVVVTTNDVGTALLERALEPEPEYLYGISFHGPYTT